MKISNEKLLEEIKKVLSEYTTKLTVRQIYYQLVSKHLIENVLSQYQRVSKLLVSARHDNKVSWDSIEDRTRKSYGGDSTEELVPDYINSWVSALKNCYRSYSLPKWKNQNEYIEIWYEKQALEGIFRNITNNYNITSFACRGYSSHTAGYELKDRIEYLDRDITKYHIKYFGDFDPSGMDIYRFIKDMCTRFNLEINFERIAITEGQIKKYNIPPMMAKKSDSRYNDFVKKYGSGVVELDALNPTVLEDLIRSSILKHFDTSIYDKVKEDQQKKRELIKQKISEILK